MNTIIVKTKNQIKSIDREITFLKNNNNNININKLLDKYKNIKCLNRIIIQEFINKIYIGKIIKKENTRNIQIKWNF